MSSLIVAVEKSIKNWEQREYLGKEIKEEVNGFSVRHRWNPEPDRRNCPVCTEFKADIRRGSRGPDGKLNFRLRDRDCDRCPFDCYEGDGAYRKTCDSGNKNFLLNKMAGILFRLKEVDS